MSTTAVLAASPVPVSILEEKQFSFGPEKPGSGTTPTSASPAVTRSFLLPVKPPTDDDGGESKGQEEKDEEKDEESTNNKLPSLKEQLVRDSKRTLSIRELFSVERHVAPQHAEFSLLDSPSQQLLNNEEFSAPSPAPPSSSSTKNIKKQLPLVVGHRGWLYQYLENTLDGFQACADLGCHAVELDVFQIKDGTLVVFHGSGSDEAGGALKHYIQHDTTNKSVSNIQDMTWEEVQECQFLVNDNPHLPCPDEAILNGRIPKLEEVLKQAKKSGLNLKIELKGRNTVKPTIEMVERLDMVDQCSFASFRPDHVDQVSKLDQEKRNQQEQEEETKGGEESSSYYYERGLLFKENIPDDFLQRALNVGATEVHLRYDTCTIERVEQIHKAGLGSMAWFRGPVSMSKQHFSDVGDEDEEMYKAVMATGVQQICCNRPDIVVGILNKGRSNKD
eukprot:scaffold4973_cov135-Cylindrotheca_fusiformis.AAC.31